MPERLVLCGGAKWSGGDGALRLALSGHLQNITLKLEDISQKLVSTVPGLLIDLLEIATYVYCADQATSRGGDAQEGMGATWRRSFRFVIPVRNPNHWSHRNVLEPLCSALSFLSEDNYAFEFEKAINPAAFEDYLDLTEDNSAAFAADEVVLFSGGLDSLSGALEEFSASGKHIALVSHRSSSKIFDHQKQLIAELKQILQAGLAYTGACDQTRTSPSPRIYTALAILSLCSTSLCCRPPVRTQQDSVLREWRSSRPGEFHPQPLTEPCLTFSCHTALQEVRFIPVPPKCSHLVDQSIPHSCLSLRSISITETSLLLRTSPSLGSALVFRPKCFHLVPFPLTSLSRFSSSATEA